MKRLSAGGESKFIIEELLNIVNYKYIKNYFIYLYFYYLFFIIYYFFYFLFFIYIYLVKTVYNHNMI
jgi:hypothetical protein